MHRLLLHGRLLLLLLLALKMLLNQNEHATKVLAPNDGISKWTLELLYSTPYLVTGPCST